jgi:hypothetical protein
MRIRFAIAALWFHVVLAVVFLLGVAGRVQQATAIVVLWVFLSVIAYSAIAIGLRQRVRGARLAGIVVVGVAYVSQLAAGRPISSLLLILIPLLLPGLPDPVTLGRRPVSGGMPRDYWD